MWFYLIIGGFFFALGLAVHRFKMHFLIAGYNTMSKEQQARVDTKRLGRLMGIYSYVNGGALFLMGILHAWGLNPGITPILVFFAISTVYLFIKARKTDGNLYGADGKLRKGAGKQLAVLTGVLVIVAVFVASLLIYSSRETKVTLLDEGLQIHGMYGGVYNWSSMEEVRLIDSLPDIEKRTNGSDVGSHLKGHFRTTEYGSVKLFVNTEKPPFIFLQNNGRTIIFNLSDAEKTQDTIKEILARLAVH